jgi:hypothetical protein
LTVLVALLARQPGWRRLSVCSATVGRSGRTP